MTWFDLLILFLTALAVTSIGFKKYVWFLSIGYGLAVAACSTAVMVLFHDHLTAVSVFQAAVLIFYGLRLSIFLIHREHSNASYRRTLQQAEKETGGVKMPLGAKTAMWISVSALYTFQVSPVLYRLANGSMDTALPAAGACISLAGGLLEAEADREKSAQKKKHPGRLAMHGLYRIVRCPNYFGEILVWLGVLAGGITTYTGIQAVSAVIAFLSIFFVMYDGAKRLDKRQVLHYGDDPESKKYMDTTPIMIPFIPVYHLYHKGGN